MLQLVLEGPSADTEGPGGVRAVAGHMRKGLANQHPFNFRQRRSRPDGKGCGIAIMLTQEIGQVLDIDDCFATK